MRKSMLVQAAAAAVVVGSLAFGSHPAGAGISDSPLAGYKAVWVVPGVINNGNNGSAFICTAHSATTLAVEVFNAAGGAPVGLAVGLALSAGQSTTVTTQTLPNLAGANDLFIGSAFQGSARISTLGGGKISCSAYVSANSGTGAGHALPVVKASGQKGE